MMLYVSMLTIMFNRLQYNTHNTTAIDIALPPEAFIYSGYFYSASSSSLLYSEALPTTALISVRVNTANGNCE